MQFFGNALVDKFGIPKDKVAEFKTIFFDTLNQAKLIDKPAIEKARLNAVRADTEIFGAGKITDQVWSGINAAKSLSRNSGRATRTSFTKLGLAHASRSRSCLSPPTKATCRST